MERENPAGNPAAQVPAILFAVAVLWQKAVPVPCLWVHVCSGDGGGQLLTDTAPASLCRVPFYSLMRPLVQTFTPPTELMQGGLIIVRQRIFL